MENKEVEDRKDFGSGYWSYRPRFIAGGLIIILGLILLGGTFMFGGAMGRRNVAFRSDRFAVVGGHGMMGGLQNGVGGMGMQARGGQLLGSVLSINGSTITVRNSSADTSVAIQSTTSFYKNRLVAKQSDLRVGDVILVRGLPDSSGVVQATVISIR